MCVCAGRGPWVTWGNLVERSGIQVTCMCPKFFAPLDCPLSAWPAWSPKHRMSRPKFKFRRPFLEIRPKMSQKSSEYRKSFSPRHMHSACILSIWRVSGLRPAHHGWKPAIGEPLTLGLLYPLLRLGRSTTWHPAWDSGESPVRPPARDLRSRTCPAWALRLHPNVSHK